PKWSREDGQQYPKRKSKLPEGNEKFCEGHQSYRLPIEISLLSRRRNRLPLNHPRISKEGEGNGSFSPHKSIKKRSVNPNKLDARIKAFFQQAKAISQERGFSPGKCNAVKDAADYVASDVKDMPATSQLCFLTRLRHDLENENSETWGLIEREVRRWRPGGWPPILDLPYPRRSRAQSGLVSRKEKPIPNPCFESPYLAQKCFFKTEVKAGYRAEFIDTRNSLERAARDHYIYLLNSAPIHILPVGTTIEDSPRELNLAIVELFLPILFLGPAEDLLVPIDSTPISVSGCSSSYQGGSRGQRCSFR
ncbi:hypothetical protein HAX54_013148, partial [Datura stramonium]|nr:hypothetical protein [Datura stramonium]